MLRIYDTRAGKKLPFEPIEAGAVGMYSCGITVYDLCHVGHARMMVAFDIIARHLRASGYRLRFVRNVTDVDDKIIRKAEAEKRTAAEVAQQYTEAMNADLRALGVAPADVEPLATEHIAEVIDIIQRLIGRGLAYAAGGDVYYSVVRLRRLRQAVGAEHRRSQGGRAHRGRRAETQPAGLRAVEGGEAGRAVVGEPVGAGAAWLAHRMFGDVAPLPGRAVRHPRRRRRPDLPAPRKRDRAVRGGVRRRPLRAPLAALGDGQLRRREDVEVAGQRRHHPQGGRDQRPGGAAPAVRERPLPQPGRLHDRRRAIRASERFPELDEAEARLDYFYRTLERLDAAPGIEADDGGAVAPPADQTRSAFQEAMDDDFNTAAAIGHLSDSFALANKLLDEPKAVAADVRRRTLSRLRRELRICGKTLGMLQRPPAEFLLPRRERLCARKGIAPAAVEARIADRAAARAGKDFARADDIRRELKDQGIELMDSAGGTAWRVVA